MADEPIVLPIGTEVSAKYKGAFCEAKIKHVVRNVKCKVTLKSGSSLTVTDTDISTGDIKVGNNVMIIQTHHSVPTEVTIVKIIDKSIYTVIFDDGDEATLKRTSLCLQSGKHFAEGDTLDRLPLTNPEHFYHPVTALGRRNRRRPKPMHSPLKTHRRTSKIKTETKQMTTQSTTSVSLETPTVPSESENSDDSKAISNQKNSKTFLNALPSDETEDSDEESLSSNSNQPSTSSSSRNSIRRNLGKKFDDDGPGFADEGGDDDADEDISESDIDTGSNEQDHDDVNDANVFLAKLISFLEVRGVSMSVAPKVNGRELNLYKLNQVIQDMGGHNRVNNQKLWHKVFKKLKLGDINAPPLERKASDEESEDDERPMIVETPVQQLKAAYMRYLHPYHDMDRKLGSATAIVDFRNMPRPSRGERKREVDRSRTNSVSSVISVAPATPTMSTPAGRKLGRASARASKVGGDVKPPESPVQATTSTLIPPTTTNENITKETPKLAKSNKEDKKRKVNPESDSNESTKQTPKEKEKDVPSMKKEPKEEIKEVTKYLTPIAYLDDSDEEAETEIIIGDWLKVKYGQREQLKVYDAKVLKIEIDKAFDDKRLKYYVHYYGWSSRYDEWIHRDRVVELIREKPTRKRTAKPKTKGAVPSDNDDCDMPPFMRPEKRKIKEEPKDTPKTERSGSISVKSKNSESSETSIRSRSRTASFSATKDHPHVALSRSSSKRTKFQNLIQKENTRTRTVSQTENNSDEEVEEPSKKPTPSRQILRKDKKRISERATRGAEKSEKKVLPDDSSEGTASQSSSKKRRTDDQTSTKQTGMTKVDVSTTDAYDFVDDDENEETSHSLTCSKVSQSSLKSGTKFLDLASTKKEDRQKTSGTNKSLFETNVEKSNSVKSAPALLESEKQMEDAIKDETLVSVQADVSVEKMPEPENKVSTSNEPESIAACEDNSKPTPVDVAIKSPHNSSTASVSSSSSDSSSNSSDSEDPEVEKILAKAEAAKAAEAESSIKAQSSSAESTKQHSSLRVSPPIEEDEDSKGSLGELVVDEGDQIGKPSPDENNSSTLTTAALNFMGCNLNLLKNESEVTQSAESGESNQEQNKEVDDSFLHCEEDVPPSPPSSPKPSTIANVVVHPPEPVTTTTNDNGVAAFFRSQQGLKHSNDRRIVDMPVDMLLGDSKQSQPFTSTPAFLANMHRTPAIATQSSISQPPTSSLCIGDVVPETSTNQPFSTLIAAAVSQQKPLNSLPKPIPAKPKTLNVIVPPNVASNIMKMDTSRAARASREEEEIAENFADDEGDDARMNDDDGDDSDDGAKRFHRKSMESTIAIHRKRRTMRSDSKMSSSNSPVPTGVVLSSQESSQDGEEEQEEQEEEDEEEEEEEEEEEIQPKQPEMRSRNKSPRSRKLDDDLREMEKMKNSVLSPQKKRGRGRGRYNAESRDISSEYSRFGRTRGRTRHTTAPVYFDYVPGFASRTHASTPTQPTISRALREKIEYLKQNPPSPYPFDYSVWEKYDIEKCPWFEPIPPTIEAKQRIRILIERMEYCKSKHLELKQTVIEQERLKKRVASKLKKRDRDERKNRIANEKRERELREREESERDESTTSSSRFEPMVSKLRNGNGRCSFRSNPITGNEDSND